MTERGIFFAALEIDSPEERATYLQGACGGDLTLRRKVGELLKEHFSNDSLLAGPALEGERAGVVDSPVREAPAQIIGRYKLLEKIGEGGFGEVWMAEQREPVKRRVALKIIKLGMDSRQIIARFEAERQALAMMDHANIAKIFDADVTDTGRPFFVMELVRGIKITEYCDQNQLPTQERLRLFILVCQAVQHAHQKGIIHRDIKPSNILVTLHDGVPVPKVIDFGIAKAAAQQELTDKTVFTQFQQFIGTPAYISPEQAEMSGLDIDTRADIYSLGVLLYELLVGQTPFDAKEMMQGGLDALRQIIREKEPLRPSTKLNTLQADARTTAAKRRQTDVGKLVHQLQGDLDWIVMKCLEKDRTRRYETANGFARDIQRHLQNEPVLARPPSGLYHFRRFVRRHRAGVMASVAVAAALLAGLAGIISQWHRAEIAGRITRERLAREHVRAGLRMAADGDALRGLPHFVEALRLGLGNAAREHVARLRFEVTIRQSPRLAQLWLPEQDGGVQFAEETERVVIIDGVEARVWDAASGGAASPPMPHADVLHNVWTDSRATRVVTETHDEQITVWEPAAARVVAVVRGMGHVRAVLGGPRLRLAVLERNDRTIKCLSALDGVVDATFEHSEPPWWAVVSRNGERLLVAAGDKLLLWDVASRTLVVPPVDFGGSPDFGTFDPSGHLAGLRLKHENSLALFDLNTGTITARGATKSLGSIRHGWLDGTRWVVLARKFSGSSLRDPVTDRLLFDAQSGAGTVTSDFAAQRNVFALVGENGASQLWDADAAQPIIPRLWAAGRPNIAHLSADAATLLISSSEPAVRLWKMPTHGGPAWIAADPTAAVATWWNAQGTQLRIVHADGRLTSRDGENGRLMFDAVALDEPPIAAVPDSAGRLVFAGSAHGARLWDIENGKPAGPLIPCAQPVRDVALSADGRRAAILMAEHILLCDPTSGTVRHTLTHHGALRCLLGADGARLATITREAVQLWAVDSGQLVGKPIAAGGKWYDAAARFDATGRRLAVWWAAPQTPGELRIVATDTGRDLLAPLQHPSVISHAVFSPAGDLLISASGDQRLSLWRTSDGLPALAPILHAGGINAVGFSSDGLLFWSRTGRLIYTWETATGDAAAPVLRHLGPRPAEPRRQASGGVVTHDDEEVRVAWSADRRVATCDARGGVNAWDFRAEARPLAEMDNLARVLSMHVINAGGVLVPLTREELRTAWEQWRRIAARTRE